MPCAGTDPIRYRFSRWAALLLLGTFHGLHDMLDGDPFVTAMLPTAGFVLQAWLLSFSQKVGEQRKWSAATAVAAMTLASLAGGLVTILLHAGRGSGVSGLLVGSASSGAGVLAFWLLIFYFPTQLGRARMRALSAENEQRKAELARLRANLHPHFLLNTLNAVAGLLVAEPQQARQLVVALGELLRDSLEEEGAMRSLADEVEWLRRYAQIFEIRHAGAIQFQWDLDPASLGIEVPRLLLQPLLENAIKHGALRKQGGGKVMLASRVAGDGVSITIEDDGPGMAPDHPPGLGLRLVRDRLKLAYPDAVLTIDKPSTGTRVSLRLPGKERA